MVWGHIGSQKVTRTGCMTHDVGEMGTSFSFLKNIIEVQLSDYLALYDTGYKTWQIVSERKCLEFLIVKLIILSCFSAQFFYKFPKISFSYNNSNNRIDNCNHCNDTVCVKLRRLNDLLVCLLCCIKRPTDYTWFAHLKVFLVCVIVYLI